MFTLVALNETMCNDYQNPSNISMLDYPAVRYTCIVTLAIIFVCGFFGNILIVVVTVWNRGLRTLTNFFLINLALADLIVSLFCIPQYAFYNHIANFGQVEHFFGDAQLCGLYLFTLQLGPTASACFLVLLAAERFIVIVYPFSKLRMAVVSKWIQVAVVGAIWFVSVGVSVPYYTTSHLYRFSFCNETSVTCSRKPSARPSKVLAMADFIIFYVGPLLAFLILYAAIAKRLWSPTLDASVPASANSSSKSTATLGDRKPTPTDYALLLRKKLGSGRNRIIGSKRLNRTESQANKSRSSGDLNPGKVSNFLTKTPPMVKSMQIVESSPKTCLKIDNNENHIYQNPHPRSPYERSASALSATEQKLQREIEKTNQGYNSDTSLLSIHGEDQSNPGGYRRKAYSSSSDQTLVLSTPAPTPIRKTGINRASYHGPEEFTFPSIIRRSLNDRVSFGSYMDRPKINGLKRMSKTSSTSRTSSSITSASNTGILIVNENMLAKNLVRKISLSEQQLNPDALMPSVEFFSGDIEYLQRTDFPKTLIKYGAADDNRPETQSAFPLFNNDNATSPSLADPKKFDVPVDKNDVTIHMSRYNSTSKISCEQSDYAVSTSKATIGEVVQMDGEINSCRSPMIRRITDDEDSEDTGIEQKDSNMDNSLQVSSNRPSRKKHGSFTIAQIPEKITEMSESHTSLVKKISDTFSIYQKISGSKCSSDRTHGIPRSMDILFSRRKTIRFLIVVTFVFAILMLPHYVRSIWTHYRSQDFRQDLNSVTILIQPLSKILHFTNSALNPFLYGLMKPKFQEALRDFFSGRTYRSAKRSHYRRAIAKATSNKNRYISGASSTLTMTPEQRRARSGPARDSSTFHVSAMKTL